MERTVPEGRSSPSLHRPIHGPLPPEAPRVASRRVEWREGAGAHFSYLGVTSGAGASGDAGCRLRAVSNSGSVT